MKVNFQGATKAQTILLLYKSHYHMKVNSLPSVDQSMLLPLSKSHYDIKLSARGKNEGLAILL